MLLGVWAVWLTGLGAWAQEPTVIWIEGEDAVRQQVTRHPGWYDRVTTPELSGGDWVSHFDDKNPGEVTYRINTQAPGQYTLWVRANPTKSTLSYRLNGWDWHLIDMSNRQRGMANISHDGKPDLRYIAWASAGQVELKAGENTLGFKFHSENSNHGALDCFVLTNGDYAPVGKRRPGERSADADPGTWAFDPDWDHFGADAALDLRSLNEDVAGQSGFVKLNDAGDELLLGDGTPARFWSVTTYGFNARSQIDFDHHIRFLAKRGVNMVRLHLQIPDGRDDQPITAARQSVIDNAQRTVAAAKKHGIYTTLSPYWAMHQKRVPAGWGIEGWPENEPPHALLFFNPTLQEGYRAWMKQLLTTPNPYTGTPLAKDPALAIIQLQNEDSLLFWTEQRIKGTQRALLGKQFHAFLVQKYGSFDLAKKAWGGAAHEDDKPAEQVAGLSIIWEMTQRRTGAKQRRLADQLEYYAKTMREFNEQTAAYLRDELGCGQVINAGNWNTADPVRLDDTERWSYAGNEIIAVNRYFNPPHVGEAVGWSIRPGHHFVSGSVLHNPRKLPVSVKQLTGKVHMVTESQWVPPNAYQAEGPVLVAAYSALTGLDSFFWFQTGATEWSPPMGKWDIATPMQLGQFPAAALMFRRGDVTQGKPVVEEHRSLDDLWQRRTPLIAASETYDPNRDTGDITPASTIRGGVDPLAFLVGPVRLTLDSDPARSTVADLKPFINAASKTVTSNTGQLRMDHAKGLFTVDTPLTQGVVGFLKGAGPVALGDIAVESQNEYASVMVVALDGEPIASSTRLLVQVGTVARPYTWRTEPAKFKAGERDIAGEKIVATGSSPWNVVHTQVKLTVKNPALATATLLDENGYRSEPVALSRTESQVQLTLPPRTLYLVIEK